jgi:nicotinamidase-related amidase
MKAGSNEVFQDIDLTPDNTAIVVVDMENEFLRPDGKYYFGSAAAAVIDANAVLLQRCRQAGVPIIYIRSVRYLDDPVFTRFGKDPYLIEGTKGSVIVDELRPLPDDSIIEKKTHDCFYNTELDQLLKRMGIGAETHRIIVTGVASNVCVYQAVVGFHVRHYYTVVPMDCTTGTPGGNDFVISQFSGPGYDYNVLLTTSDRITFRTHAELAG